MKQLVYVLPLVGMLAACGSTKSPTKQAAPAQSTNTAVEQTAKASTPTLRPNDPYAKYYPVEQESAAPVQAPVWFVRPPSDRLDVLFAVGTATSTDEQMAYDKARMSAERKLVESAGIRVQSQTKSYKADRGAAIIENYEQVVRKNANGELVGAQRVDSQVTFDGRSYKVYVLMRLPLGEQNVARRAADQNKLQRESEIRARAAQRELDMADQKEFDRSQDNIERLKEEVGPPKPISSLTPDAPVTVQ